VEFGAPRGEQRKIEKLLIALTKKKPVSPSKPAPISNGQSAMGTGHPTILLLT